MKKYDFGLSSETLTEILKILQKEPTVSKVVIFGSRAMGNYKNGSDIDLAVFGDEDIDKAVDNISFALNEHDFLPYKFDVINYQNCSNEKLKEHIDREGKLFYRRNSANG